MFGKLKASLGIGAAKVDTVLDSIAVMQGESIRGTVHIYGGDVAQQVDAINLKLCTEIKVETEESTSYQSVMIGQLRAVQAFVIEAGEHKQVPFDIKLDDETPITALNVYKNQCHVWIETTLDIDFALDPKDRDYVEVHPLPVVAKVISAIQSAGFELIKADVEKGFLRGHNFSSKSGFYQEIEFRNRGFIDRKEIELSFVLEGNVVHCLAEVDRALGRGDQYTSFTLSRHASDTEVSHALSRVLSI